MLLCQKNDSYTNLVYSKDTFGTLLTISQRFNFSEFPFTDLLPPFNIPDSLGVPSFLFLFSFQRATSCFLYILERLESHFILKWDKFLFFGQKGERIGTCTSIELTFCFSSRHQMDHVHLLCTIKFWHFDAVLVK